jgi:adenylate cyclase
MLAKQPVKTRQPATLPPAVSRLIHFQDGFDRQLEQEIMRSECLRARFFCIAFAILAVFAVIVDRLFPSLVEGIFLRQISLWPVVAVLAGYSAYEFGFKSGIGWFLRKELKFPLLPKLGNAVIESSFPTVLSLMLAAFFPISTVLGMPPSNLYFLFIILSALRLEPALSVLTGAVAAGSYLLLALFAQPVGAAAGSLEWWVSMLPWLSKSAVLLIAGLMAGFVASQIRGRLVGVIRSREERNLIASIFGQHVSPAVMERLVHQRGGVDSETREVGVLFLDIRDFTRFSHSRRPDEVVDYLNSLFDFMIEIVNRNHGVINKFLGDGFMAIFGAPLADGEAALNAVRSALELSDRLATEVAAGRVEPTRIGIGIHYGHAVTGSVGSQLRREYTVIGDVVNLASRIEQLNKEYKSEILLSREAWDAARAGLAGGDGTLGAAVELGEVAVKGRERPVSLIRLR